MDLGQYFFTPVLTDLDHINRKLNTVNSQQNTHNSQMDTIGIIASLGTVSLFEDGETVPVKVAQKARNYPLDPYTEDWYKDKQKALQIFGLSQYLEAYLLELALRTTMDTLFYIRKSALTSLRRQKTAFLTEEEIGEILHILF